MTLPQNVKDAVGRVDRSLSEWRICQSPWQTIRAHLLSQEAEIERLQSGLAAADAMLETTERTLERCKQTLDTTSECWRLDSERLEAAERNARVTKRSAETLCRIYFEIAAEAVGEDKVRAERDRRIHAAQDGEE